VTGLPPIFDQLRHQLGLSSVGVTVLATAPVLCFGIFSPVAATVGRRLGEERGLAIALLAGAIGLGLRAVFPRELLLVGTIIAGGAIAFMNVLIPSLIKRRARHRANLLLSLYLVTLNVGAIAGSAIVVPVYRATHGSLLITLGLFVVPMGVGLAAWLPQLRTPLVRPVIEAPRASTQIHRHGVAWQVTAFMGLQGMTFYATLSFLPDLLLSRGLASSQTGLIGTLLGVGGIAGAFVVPLVVHRSARIARSLMVGTIVVCAGGIASALVLPVGAALGVMLLLGVGQGAAISLAVYFVIARAETSAVAASLSALAQGFGYLLAALGPLTVGLLHSATHAWTAPVVFLLVATGVELVVGLLAARERTVPATRLDNARPAALIEPTPQGSRA
jgi:MFS transporter, CP family, cyanate transporter